MEKLKDFFYDKNDLVVALIIIVAAGCLIFWRVNCIMDYPQVMAAQAENQGSLSSNGTMDDVGTGDGTDGSGSDSGDGQAGGPDQTPATTPGGTTASNGNITPPNTGSLDTTPPADNSSAGKTPPASGTSVSVTIPSGSSSDQIAQLLVDAGLVSSKKDFISAVTAANADRKLKAGTFKIPADSTTAQVVSIITK